MLCGVEMYLFDSDYWLTLHWLALFLSGYHADVVPTSQFTVQAVFCLEHGISTFLCVWKLCSKSNHCKMCGNHVIYCFPWSSLVCIQVADVAPKWDMGKEGERDSCMVLFLDASSCGEEQRETLISAAPVGCGDSQPSQLEDRAQSDGIFKFQVWTEQCNELMQKSDLELKLWGCWCPTKANLKDTCKVFAQLFCKTKLVRYKAKVWKPHFYVSIVSVCRVYLIWCGFPLNKHVNSLLIRI